MSGLSERALKAMLRRDAAVLVDLANRALTVAHYLRSMSRLVPELRGPADRVEEASSLLLEAARGLGVEVSSEGRPQARCAGCEGGEEGAGHSQP